MMLSSLSDVVNTAREVTPAAVHPRVWHATMRASSASATEAALVANQW